MSVGVSFVGLAILAIGVLLVLGIIVAVVVAASAGGSRRDEDRP
jgi:hypothetical protein